MSIKMRGTWHCPLLVQTWPPASPQRPSPVSLLPTQLPSAALSPDSASFCFCLCCLLWISFSSCKVAWDGGYRVEVRQGEFGGGDTPGLCSHCSQADVHHHPPPTPPTLHTQQCRADEPLANGTPDWEGWRFEFLVGWSWHTPKP